jgi:hypothetical protein
MIVCFMALPCGKNDGVMADMADWCKKKTCMSTIKVATYPPKGHWKQLNWISHYCMIPNLFEVLVQWCNQDWKELHLKLVNHNERPKTCWISSKQTKCLQVMATKSGASIKRNRNLWTHFGLLKYCKWERLKRPRAAKLESITGVERPELSWGETESMNSSPKMQKFSRFDTHHLLIYLKVLRDIRRE